MAKKELQEGAAAPDFTLPDQDGNKVKLSSFKGKKNVVLYFYPKDMTPGCTTEACDFSGDAAKFSKKDAVILGVSFDDAASHQKFIAKHKLKLTLLSDSDKKVADKYGVYQEKSLYGRKFMGIVRSTFVIDNQGKLKKIFPKVKVAGHSDEVLKALSE
ncbi:MAG: thioredoxin-dependent thiol peroxidase [Deltaproteobacteria bacterium]|nr:thioredoxin-dependent thiol peroxidase [Deltaproteobacteria bacterium]